MNAQAVLKELESLGSESYRRILANHGVAGPCYGVKIEELKKIQKRIKKDHELALALYASGNYDARYLAGLIADGERMTARDLTIWVEEADRALSGSIVPGVAANSAHGWELALTWIDSNRELVAAAGWATLSAWVSTKPDDQLDLSALRQLLQRVERSLREAPNAVRYQMNGFVIAAGCFVTALTEQAKDVGSRLGRIDVDMGKTACQVPYAPDYIQKVMDRGSIGKKRRGALC